MDELISTLITTTTNSFDFTFCITVNIATYITIKTITDVKHNHKISTWSKRGIFLIVSLIVAIVYYVIGSDTKVLFNSVILAPVSWSWIFKPLCNRLHIDYNTKSKDITTINDTLKDIL